MIGMRDHLGQWWKVTQDCTRCGQCCMDQGPSWKFAEDKIMGGCKYLEELDSGEYNCSLRMYRPLGCAASYPNKLPEYCSVKFKKVKSGAVVLR
jgi:hypothetical protein